MGARDGDESAPMDVASSSFSPIIFQYIHSPASIHTAACLAGSKSAVLTWGDYKELESCITVSKIFLYVLLQPLYE